MQQSKDEKKGENNSPFYLISITESEEFITLSYYYFGKKKVQPLKMISSDKLFDEEFEIANKILRDAYFRNCWELYDN